MPLALKSKTFSNPMVRIVSILLFLLPAIVSAAGVTLSATPTTLTKANNTVLIQWSDVPSPSDLDWVGIYSPPDSPDDHYIGYLILSSSSPDTWASGHGSLSIPLSNLRHPFSFRLFRWTRDEVDKSHVDIHHNPVPSSRRRLAVSQEVAFERGSTAPDQIHLALTDREDEMRVMFVAGDGSERSVRYGADAGRLDRVGRAEARTYERSDMCDGPANSTLGWRDPGFAHDGVMTELERGRRYYYQVGSDAGGWSATYSFISRDSGSNETIAFLFGDMGTYAPYTTFYRTQEESKTTVKWILRDIEALGDKPAFVSHIGDLSYALGYSWIWDEFFNQIDTIASQVPYHVCIGNHEYDWPLQPWRPSWALGVYGDDGGGECGVPYSVRFKMPGNSSLPTGTRSPDTRNLYYSFDAGVVHFLYISTETNFLQGSDQYKFIKADLEGVDREKTPFIVVQGHRPMYTTSYELRDAPTREKMLESLEPLLVDHNVTLALWGHVHRYERFCPLRNHACVDTSLGSVSGGATVHVVIGMGGQDWQSIWEPRPDQPDVPIFPQPARSMYRGGEFGYTRLVATREKLTLTYIGNHDGEMHDIVEISSGRAPEDDGGEVVSKVATGPRYSWYVKGAGVLVLGVFAGYGLGFFTHRRRHAAPSNTWTPVMAVEL